MAKKRLPVVKVPHLKDAALKKIVPMFVESGNATADHKCGSCRFRVGSNKCAIVKGAISFKRGSCSFWAKGSASPQVNKVRMPKGLSGYVEVKSGQKINCASCVFESKGLCKLWNGAVHAGDCCMAWKQRN